jgi:hypothetical protein
VVGVDPQEAARNLNKQIIKQLDEIKLEIFEIKKKQI